EPVLEVTIQDPVRSVEMASPRAAVSVPWVKPGKSRNEHIFSGVPPWQPFSGRPHSAVSCQKRTYALQERASLRCGTGGQLVPTISSGELHVFTGLHAPDLTANGQKNLYLLLCSIEADESQSMGFTDAQTVVRDRPNHLLARNYH